MYQRILVPVDGSSTSNAGLVEAMKLAKPAGARLRLVHVIDEMPFVMNAEGYGAMSGDVLAMLKQAGEKILAQARSQLENSGIAFDTVLYDRPHARLSDCIADQIRDWGADLIVIGTHGRRGVQRMLLGSDAEQVARAATVPVLLVRSPEAAA